MFDGWLLLPVRNMSVLCWPTASPHIQQASTQRRSRMVPWAHTTQILDIPGSSSLLHPQPMLSCVLVLHNACSCLHTGCRPDTQTTVLSHRCSTPQHHFCTVEDPTITLDSMRLCCPACGHTHVGCTHVRSLGRITPAICADTWTTASTMSQVAELRSEPTLNDHTPCWC
jgi:hypothetical protein